MASKNKASKRKPGRGNAQQIHLDPAILDRIWRTAPRASVPVLYVAGAIISAWPQHTASAAGIHPPLPTPCAGAPCGINLGNTPFVQSGQIGNGGLPAINGTTMAINQLSKSAILNWKDFNIANGYSVKFTQPSSTSAALNRIWSADPSVIAGKLSANGQIYLINQNGILFANGAQINVGGLTASALDISDSTFLNGLLSQNSQTQLSSGHLLPVFDVSLNSTGTAGGITVESGAQITAADGGRVMLLGSTVTNQGAISTPDGQTILGAGNKIYLASTSDPTMRGLLVEVDGAGSSGGSISNVTNQGQIIADRGNITLAGFAVNQSGLVSATSSVNANGSIYLVAGDTSLPSPDGSIPLFYNNNAAGLGQGQMLANVGGTLTLAPGSVTEIQPDATDTATITDSQSFYNSQINLVGKNIDMMGNAAIRAPGATVSAVAALNPFDYAEKEFAKSSLPEVVDGSRIYLDAGSSIDVSGLSDVAIAATRNLIPVRLGVNELADDPLLRDGPLHGQTVTIDVTKGSTLLNANTLKSYQNTIGRGIDEKMTVGGTITLSSDGDVVTRSGSIQNMSGGSIDYQSAYGQSPSKLLGANGRLYDITTAPTNIQYVGVADSYSYTDPKWGVTHTWSTSNQSFIPGYMQGANAGRLTIHAPEIYLRGSMLGLTTTGINQRSATTLPKGGTFVLGDSDVLISANGKDTEGNFNLDAPSVLLEDGATDTLGTDFSPDSSTLPKAFQNSTVISPTSLTQNGFNNIEIDSNGAITLPANARLTTTGNGSLTMNAQSIAIDGDIYAPGSTISLTTRFNLAGPPISSHDIILGDGASIDVSGTWVNDSPLVTTQPTIAPTLYAGGQVALNSYGNVLLGDNSLIDVSGGGWVNSGNKLTTGNGGTISLNADVGFDPTVEATSGVDLGGGKLFGASLSSGGTLSMTSAWVNVSADGSGSRDAGQLVLQPGFFTQGGFSQYNIKGINGVVLGGSDGGMPVAINPQQKNLVFTQNSLLKATGSDLASFTSLELLKPELRAPASVSFTATSSLVDPETGEFLGNVSLNPGSSITTDPGASVTLNARENLTVLGDITAPAGRILLQLANSSIPADTTNDLDGYAPNRQVLNDGVPILIDDVPEMLPNQELLIGGNAKLSAPGFSAIYTDNNPLGYRQGQMLSGGNIQVLAYKGSVVAQSGSVLDVSAASGTVDVANSGGVTPTVVAGKAGSIDVEARENLVLNSALKGLPAQNPASNAPVAGADGGSLTIGVGLGFDLSKIPTYNIAQPSTSYPIDPATGLAYDRNLIVTSVGKAFLPDTLSIDKSGVSTDNNSPINQDGVGIVSTSTFANGGFANLTIKSPDIVTLDGSLSGTQAQRSLILNAKDSLTIDALKLSATSNTQVSLNSAYVALGTQNYYPTGNGESGRVYTPIAGNADATVTASLIDIRGKSVLSGFYDAVFNSTGDIRFSYGTQGSGGTSDFQGLLKTTASLTFDAAQLYPTTYANFTINPTDVASTDGSIVDPTLSASYSYTPGPVAIYSNGAAAPVPLSALGSLTIDSPDIAQHGVLRAPLGQLALNGIGASGGVELEPGSLTSVSAEGQLIPFGSTQNGQQWIYPVDSQGTANTIDALPAKQVNLNADQVAVNAGAKVDLSGGGDLYAYEFIAGSGGSKDVLDPANGVYKYAIVPSLGSQFAPIDHQYGFGYNTGGSGAPTLNPGNGVYLSGVPGLADGFYALLPARYALLPGAYAVNVVKSTSDIAVGTAIKQADGSYLVAGRDAVAGTDVIDSRTSTFLLTPGTVVRTQSQYTDSYANAFFTNAAAAAKTTVASLPADAGQLQLAAIDGLALNGTVGFTPGQFVNGKDSSGNDIVQQGRGGDVSIDATQLEVVNQATPDDGFLHISAGSLNNLGASSLILGATRATAADGDQLTVGATNVVVNSDASLSAPEIILAAKDNVELDGSLTAKSGTLASTSNILNVSGDGALLRLSSGSQMSLVRSGVGSSPQGTLTLGSSAVIAKDAAVKASSLILDAAADTQVSTTQIDAQAVTASSSRISLGDVPNGTSGLNVTPQLLSSFGGITDLTLHSYSTIDFYAGSAPIMLGAVNHTGGHSVPVLQSITLDAGGVGGYGSFDTNVNAGSIALTNVGGSSNSFVSAPDGTGQLALSALSTGTAGSGQINLGAGDKTIQGFGGGVNLSAAGDIRGQGTGSLNFNLTDSGALNLTAARFSTDNGATQDITTNGSVSIAAAGGGAVPNNKLAAAGLGGKLTLTGTDITDNGRIDLPAGIVSLTAKNGDVTLGNGSGIDATGAAKSYFDTYAVAAGGTVNLSASNNVSIDSGATIDVSGVTAADGKTSGDAGSLNIVVPQGQFNLNGAIKGGAAPGNRQGNFALDTSTLAANGDFAALNSALASGGFEGAVSVRDRNDAAVSIDTGVTIRASSYELSADNGSITVGGKIDTSGNASSVDGGTIALWSSGNLALASGAELNSSAGTPSSDAPTRGGNIVLGSANGVIDIQSGSRIELTGQKAGTSSNGSQIDPDANVDGQLKLRAQMTNNETDVAVSEIGATIQGSKPVLIQGFKSYTAQDPILTGAGDVDSGGNINLDAQGLQSLSQDTQAFANAETTIAGRFTGHVVQVRPEVEVQSDGDINLNSDLDLNPWQTGGVPVDLTLRAKGNLTFNASLSDGFINPQDGSSPANWSFGGGNGNADSASYRLIAGADTAAANPLAVQQTAIQPGSQPASGNFELTKGNLIRTGNGTIDIAASGNVRLDDQTSVIYTAGVPTGNPSDFSTPVFSASGFSDPAYPTNGGNITISAGNDMIGAPTTNLISNWLWRQGFTQNNSDQSTSWWIEFNQFQQGVGALGGGDIAIRAGGNVTNLSAVIPTAGRLAKSADNQADVKNLIVDGGGDLTVQAGNDVLSGIFQDDLGHASISAGNAIESAAKAGDTSNIATNAIVMLADSTFDLNARTDVSLDAAGNSTAFPQSINNEHAVSQSGSPQRAFFFTYDTSSALDITSVGGNVALGNLASLSSNKSLDSNNSGALQIYPSNLDVAALSGDIDLSKKVQLFPSPTGSLELLAQGNVNFSAGSVLQMIEADPGLVPGVLNPIASLSSGGALSAPLLLPQTPLHKDDPEPIKVIAATGSIEGNNSSVTFPKQADLIAGQDISDVNFVGKNLNPSDVTLFEAGGDITYQTPLSSITGQLASNSNGIKVGGPGVVEVLAGGKLDLGNSAGIDTNGNFGDVRLPAAGANLVVGAGFGAATAGGLRAPAYDAFIGRYLEPDATGNPSIYATQLIKYLGKLNPADAHLSATDALTAFLGLTRQQQLPIIAQVLSAELDATGVAHTTQGTDYQRGYDAIATLFPTKDAAGNPLAYSGDINMFFSQLKTEQGGDINLLAPGGSVVVGVPNPPAQLTDLKQNLTVSPPVLAAANLGILVLANGAVRGFANGDFDVNQSRILTLQGGDIILWSSYGNIDAGKGAATAQGAPPPVIQTDSFGNVFVNPVGAVSGSGIGQLLTVPGIVPGSVDLIAPTGFVNAGDAGIRVAGNLNIAAVAVLNASNIKVGGTSSGVPVSDAGALSGALSGASALGDTSKNVAAQLSENLSESAADSQKLAESFKPSFVVVKLFCLGADCEAE